MGEGHSKGGKADPRYDGPSVAGGDMNQKEYKSLQQRSAPRGLKMDYNPRAQPAPAPAAAPAPVQQVAAPMTMQQQVPYAGMRPQLGGSLTIPLGLNPGAPLQRSDSMIRIQALQGVSGGVSLPRSDSMVRLGNGTRAQPLQNGTDGLKAPQSLLNFVQQAGVVNPTGAAPSLVPNSMQRSPSMTLINGMQRSSSMVRISAQQDVIVQGGAMQRSPSMIMRLQQQQEVLVHQDPAPSRTLGRSSSRDRRAMPTVEVVNGLGVSGSVRTAMPDRLVASQRMYPGVQMASPRLGSERQAQYTDAAPAGYDYPIQPQAYQPSSLRFQQPMSQPQVTPRQLPQTPRVQGYSQAMTSPRYLPGPPSHVASAQSPRGVRRF